MNKADPSKRQWSIRAGLVAAVVLPLRMGGIPYGWENLHRTGSGPRQRRVDAVRLWPGGTRIVLKSFVSSSAAIAEHAHQRDVATRIPKTLPPLFRSRLGAFVAMPYLRGRDVLEAIGEDDFEGIVRRPMEWLRALHDSAPSGASDAVLLADLYDQLLGSLDDRSSAEMVARVQEWRDRAADCPPIQTTLVHGDLHPGNVIVFGDDFCVIDFEDVDDGLPILDLAQFLGHLEARIFLRHPEVARGWDSRVRDILTWYGRPDLLRDGSLGLAMQLRRLHMLSRMEFTGTVTRQKARAAFLRARLDRPDPKDALRP